MSYTLAPPSTRLKIWQQNLNKSDKAQFDLINAPLHKEWDLLLLQEPYIDSFGNTKATSRWHILYPSSHLADSPTCRSVILVNASLDMNAWAQVTLEGSNDLTAYNSDSHKAVSQSLIYITTALIKTHLLRSDYLCSNTPCPSLPLKMIT